MFLPQRNLLPFGRFSSCFLWPQIYEIFYLEQDQECNKRTSEVGGEESEAKLRAFGELLEAHRVQSGAGLESMAQD